MSHIRLLLLWALVGCTALNAQQIEIGLAYFLTNSKARDFSKKLEQNSYGRTKLEKAVEDIQPNIAVSSSIDSRYLLIAKISNVWLWECRVDRKPFDPDNIGTYLARVDLHFMVFDTHLQETVVRDTARGYAAYPKERHYEGALTELRLLAFDDATSYMAVQIARRFPIAAEVYENDRSVLHIASDIKNWVNTHDTLQVMDFETAERLCFVDVFKLTHYGFSAVVNGKSIEYLGKGQTILLQKNFPERPAESQYEQQIVFNTIRRNLAEKVEIDDNLISALDANPRKYLHATLKSNRLRVDDPIEIAFHWSHDAPEDWYSYLLHITSEEEVILYFPNNLGRKIKKYRVIQLIPGKPYNFPGRQWGIRRLKAALPAEKSSCQDYYVLLVTQNKINTIEQKLEFSSQTGLRLASLAFEDIKTIHKDLAKMRWNGAVMSLEIAE